MTSVEAHYELHSEPKQGKVILIMGCPRTGKTTLAVRLVKSGKKFSRMSGDHLSTFVGEAEIQGFDFSALIEGLVKDSEIYGMNTVFDCTSYDFPLEAVDKLPFKNKLDIYFFGFPDISEDEIRYNIKHYSKPTDWIYHLSEESLAQSAKYIYDFNIKLKEFCETYGYKFICTGVGAERDAILNLLYDEIIEKYGL